VRVCTAEYEHMDDAGNPTVSEIRVRYFSQTVAELKQQRAAALKRARELEKRAEGSEKADIDIDNDDFPWLSHILVNRLESLPDLTDEKGKPLPITIESLDQLTAANLRAIEAAIAADVAPKSQPSNVPKAGSSANKSGCGSHRTSILNRRTT